MKRVPLLVAVALSAVVLPACGGSPGDTLAPGAATVDASTSPEDVVRTYLGALQGGHQAAAASLTTQPYSGRDQWAADPPTIEDVEVSEAITQPTTGAEGAAGEGHAQEHAQAVFVPVTFELHGADVSMPDGPTAWGYLLVRDGGAEAWRIADAGSA
ncbi:hypothetical protein MO973_10575 [Paenibacillus sp. TRM 82003]|uniref:hypothetical protein n=1 Tax=Kineococcus sp. TRM81007 TaxID=2925831 RepID=UPI001F5761FD|nr:hypothetical protein [Kineococcus sp. TRM81007]MCI2239217.1 hypothetical protein [Kineococcus sp. TRM81007]MCI3920678.1 hypothetical protein [Paenibacillus sp. TRM 82003]